MALVKPNDFAPSTVAESAKVDANFDLLYNLLNGTSTDQDAIIRLNHGSLPVLRLDQLGSGPIFTGRANLTELFKMLVSGEFQILNGFEQITKSTTGNMLRMTAGGKNWVVAINASGHLVIGEDGVSNAMTVDHTTGIVTFEETSVGPAADPTTNNQYARKLYIDTRRNRWAATFFVPDVAARGVDSNFDDVQGAWIPGSNFFATHISYKAQSGTASGTFSFEMRKMPFANQTQTNLGGPSNVNPSIGAGVEIDISDHQFTANDYVYPVFTAMSSPLHKSLWIAVRGYQTPENP